MNEIAIVGGGPSGAVCGERLAQAGFRVTLFDEHLAKLGVLSEIQAGKENLFIHPKLMQLLTRDSNSFVPY